jgi:hypothetical protein
LIDGGETHNFIDSALVAKRGIHMMDFEGFDVAVAGRHVIPCTQKISQLCLTLGNYTVTDDFYVVELQDTNVILGVQWLVSIGRHTIDYCWIFIKLVSIRFTIAI